MYHTAFKCNWCDTRYETKALAIVCQCREKKDAFIKFQTKEAKRRAREKAKKGRKEVIY
jgi:hypothetical protein